MKKFWLLAFVIGAMALAPVNSPADITDGNCLFVTQTCSYDSGCGSCHASSLITFYCPDDQTYYTYADGCCSCA
jgi:hypothetical protein